jgi:predicted kinase
VPAQVFGPGRVHAFILLINMDIMKKRRTEVIGFLKEHDGKFVQIGNVYHCEKLFIIFSVYNWVCEEKENGLMVEEDVQYHLDLINKFIQDKVQLSWDKEDKLSIEGFA